MLHRPRALGAVLAVWALAGSAGADVPAAKLEPSLIVYRQLAAQAELTDAQRDFFGPFFEAHAAQLRDMRERLNAGELSYVGAILEGRSLERRLNQEADARLDEEQRILLGQIRDGLRAEFRAMFFEQEHAWWLRLFGRSEVAPPAADRAGPDVDEKS